MPRNFIALLPVLLATAASAADGKIIARDDFRPGLIRHSRLSMESPAEAWKLEAPVALSHEQLLFRFSSGARLLKSLELVESGGGKTVWRRDNFTRPAAATPKLPAGEYVIRCSGDAGADNFSMAVNALQDGRSMPSWTLKDALAEFPPGGGMRLTPEAGKKTGSFEARISGLTAGKHYEVELAIQSGEPMELLMRHGQRVGGERKFGEAKFKTGVDREQTWQVPFPAQAASFTVTVHFPGKCLFRSLVVREVEPPAETRKSGAATRYFEPRNSVADPANPALAAPAAYRRNPRMTYQDSVPQPFELIDRLETFTTQGNYAVWHFAIHNPGSARELDLLRISDLRCGDRTIPAASIKASHVKFWDFPINSYNYHNVPDLILPQEKRELPAGGNLIFWLQTRLGDDCAPGIYTGTAGVKCGEKEIVLPVSLKVLPFALRTPPDMVWTIYSQLHVPPQRRYSMELTTRYLEDIKNYGVTSLLFRASSEDAVKRIQEARRNVGMDGPLVLDGLAADRKAAKRRGLDPKDGKWFEHPEVRDEFVAVIKEFDSWVKRYGGPGYDQWYYMGVDEPHNNNRMETAEWQNRLARQAGVPTMSNVYAPRYVLALSSDLTVSSNSFIANNAETNRQLREIGEKHHIGYWYLGTGAYGGQNGGLMPNRLLSGFLTYKLGVPGHLIYAYQTFGDDPYDEFARRMCGITYPDLHPTVDNVSVFTLAWEGIREGIADYKYLYTLQSMIEEARVKGKAAEADAGKAVLDEIIGFIPWRDDHKPGNGIMEDRVFDNAKADSLRAMAAAAILKLKEIL